MEPDAMNAWHSGPVWGAARRTGAPTATAFNEAYFADLIPIASLRHMPDPAQDWIGPHAGDRTCDLNRLELSPSRCGPTTECRRTEPTQWLEVAPITRRSRFLR